MDQKIEIGFSSNEKFEIMHKDDKFEWNDLGDFLMNYLNGEKDNKIKKDFIKAVEYIYNFYNLEELAMFSTYDRYHKYMYLEKNDFIKKYAKGISINASIDFNSFLWETAKENYGKEIDDEQFYLSKTFSILNKLLNINEDDDERDTVIEIPYFYVGDTGNILFLVLAELVSRNIPIRQCKNCNKYFIPVNRRDELYCNYKNKDGKTCKQIGFWETKKKKYEEDEFSRLYRNTYQQKFLRVKRNPGNKEYVEDFENFKKGVKKMKVAILADEKTEDDFKKWLMEVKNS